MISFLLRSASAPDLRQPSTDTSRQRLCSSTQHHRQLSACRLQFAPCLCFSNAGRNGLKFSQLVFPTTGLVVQRVEPDVDSRLIQRQHQAQRRAAGVVAFHSQPWCRACSRCWLEFRSASVKFEKTLLDDIGSRPVRQKGRTRTHLLPPPFWRMHI